MGLWDRDTLVAEAVTTSVDAPLPCSWAARPWPNGRRRPIRGSSTIRFPRASCAGSSAPPATACGCYVVLGWPAGAERRKHGAAAAVTNADGKVVAVASATWIEPRQTSTDADHPTGA